MKKIFVLLMALALTGCASLSYEAKEGTKETKVSYSRLFTTSDKISGELPGGAKIESNNQKIDAATIEAILKLLGTIQ
ncbi:MAG: hypothetical protein ABFD75_12275 [Smithella sp.]